MAQKILAYARKWVVDGIKPKRIKGEDGKPYLPLKFSFHELTQRRILRDDVALVDIAECEKLEETLKKVREQRGVEVRRANELEKEVERLRKFKARIEAVDRSLRSEGPGPTMISGCAGVMISLAAENGSTKSIFTQEGVTYGDIELGDWRVTIEKIG